MKSSVTNKTNSNVIKVNFTKFLDKYILPNNTASSTVDRIVNSTIPRKPLGKVIGTAYLDRVFNYEQYKSVVDKVSKKVSKLKDELDFDAIAFRGISGAGVAFPVSYLTKIPLILVRKPNESSHGYSIEGPPTLVKSCIILDDFIATGNTIKEIYKAISVKNIECKGILVYSQLIDCLIESYSVFSKSDLPNDIKIYGVQC